MLLYIRFRGQLRRTRPELIASLEDAVIEAATAAGAAAESTGEIRIRHKILTASFDEDRIGFWLDMIIFLDKIHKILKKAEGELYGYTLVLGQDIPETSSQMLCRSLSKKSSPGNTGIWCAGDILKALELYVVFRPGDSTSNGAYGTDGYRELREWRSFDNVQRESPYHEKIERILARGAEKNTILLGSEFIGKREGMRRYCAGHLGNIPPLVVCFGAGGRGLVCFADAWTPELRSFVSGAISAEMMKELDTLHSLLFRERLRDEWSPYMVNQGRRFIYSLLSAYIAAAKARLPDGVPPGGPAGALILENPSLADNDAIVVFKEVYSSLPALPKLAGQGSSQDDKRGGLLLLASDEVSPGGLSAENPSGEDLKSWGGIFTRILKFSSDEFPVPKKTEGYGNNPKDGIPEEKIPQDLWELSYNIFLLGRFFPAYLFPQLFEEEGLNRNIYFEAVRMLAALSVLAPGDAHPIIPDFVFRAGKALGNRKEKIHSAVRKIILAWAGSGRDFVPRVRPCFNLLKILSELGERAEDALVLRSLKADVLNGTWKGIEQALGKKSFVALAGAGNAPVLSYIYRTLKVLVWGDSDEIQRVFQEPVPPLVLDEKKSCYGAYRAQVQTNLAAFYIGVRNTDEASKAVRKAMLLNRDLGENAVPTHRLFSLVNLSKKRIDDALEYISFALEQAERTEQSEELVLTFYFASSINFLYGNLSRAERLAVRAEETASTLGQSGWAMRARFLLGRINFEIGRYDDALEIFESLGNAAGHETAGMTNTVYAWINRAKVFLGQYSPLDNEAVPSGSAGGKAGGNGDWRIFETEAAYLAGDYSRAAALAEDFLSSSREKPGGDFIFTEQPDWRSGFAQCEYMFLPEKVPGTRFVWVYRAMAQCAGREPPEVKAGILGGMQRFIRDELLPDTDPNDAFYYYAWYSMLRDAGADHVDMTTVVSMAFKRLQRRAARIDDVRTKQAFLTMPRWNSTLSLAAREYKLI